MDPEKAAAEELKLEGNNFYKARQLPEAIECYDKAWQTYPKDISYLNNKAAAIFESGDYNRTLEVCQEAITRGKEIYADLEKVGRALGRMGTAYFKLGDIENAIEYT